MTAKWATTLIVIGALCSPVAYGADTTTKAKDLMDDSAITTKIKGEFAKDKEVSAMAIHVDTSHGVVKLSGNAKSKDEADKAVAIAKGTKGVTSVDNQIKVGMK